jgi:tetratricopeptide (TPR) repeat protein
MDLSFDLSDSGLVLLTLHRPHEAAAAYEEALALRREVATSDPDNFLARATVGRTLYRVARAYDEDGRIDPAIEACRQAASILAAAHTRDPANRDILAEAGLAALRLGFLYRERAVTGREKSGAADWGSAQTAFEKATSLLDEFGAVSKLPDDDQEHIRQMGPALEECRRKALAPGVGPKPVR